MDNTFELTFDNWEGFAPAAHLNSLTEMGSMGSASLMTDCDVLSNVLTQGPGLTELSNMSSLNEMMNFVMDVPPENGITYGIGDTKLYQITSTELIVVDESAVLGTELVVNGGFTGNANGWGLFGGWAYNNNNVICTPGQTEDILQMSIPEGITEGKTYRISMDIGGSNGSVTFYLCGNEIGTYSAFAGTITEDYFLVTIQGESNFIEIFSDVDFDGTIDDVSVRERISGSGAFPHTITNCTQGEDTISITTI